MNAIGQSRLPRRQADTLWNAEDSKDEYEKDCKDKNGFTHGKTGLFRFLLVSRHRSDRALDDLYFYAVRWNAQLNRVFLERNNSSPHAAGGGDAVARFEAC